MVSVAGDIRRQVTQTETRVSSLGPVSFTCTCVWGRRDLVQHGLLKLTELEEVIVSGEVDTAQCDC